MSTPTVAVPPRVPTAAAIQIEHVTKRYRNGLLANDGISLAVDEGTTLGILGYNGAGKTTLVRQLTGELQPTSGTLRVLGVDVVREHTRARALMGVVPQEAEPYEHLTVQQHLALFGRMRGLSRGDAGRRADELVGELGLTTHASVVARNLSGGLKRKLLVANALVGDPPVLVLDEPTTGLDPHARREVWSLLRGLRGRGRTIVMTTHYMEEAEELCDRVALVAGGRLYVEGTIDELRARCESRYRATYEHDGRDVVLTGQSSEELLRDLKRRGVEEFTLTKTRLEDVYLELTAQAARSNGA